MASQFTCDVPLREHMDRKDLHTIAVEVVSSQHSDIEITELYIHLMREKQADYFVEKKHFRSVPTDFGRVILPPYRLEYDDTVVFNLKKTWIFHSIRTDNIRL